MAITDFLTQPMNDLIYGLFAPFILIMAILFGSLQFLHVFDKKVNIVVSLAITLFFINTEYFLWFSQYMAQLGSYAVLGTFFALFIWGSLWFGLRRGREIYYEHAEPTKRITRLAKEKEKIWKEYEKARERGDDHKARALWENMRQIDADMEYERHKMRRAY